MKKLFKIILGIVIVNVIVKAVFTLVKKSLSEEDIEKFKGMAMAKLEELGINFEEGGDDVELAEEDVVEEEVNEEVDVEDEVEVEFES